MTRVYFEPGGSYAAWMSKATPLAGEILARLPNQPYLVAGMARISAQTNFDGLRAVFPDKMPADEADKLVKDCRKAMQRITEAGVLVYRVEAAKDDAKLRDKIKNLEEA